MIIRTVLVLIVLLLVSGHRAEAQIAMECRGGKFAASDDPPRGAKPNCPKKGTGRGLAIDLGPATYSFNLFANSPECQQGLTDRIVRETARFASSLERPAGLDLRFDSFRTACRTDQRFGNNFGNLASKLVGKGGAVARSSSFP